MAKILVIDDDERILKLIKNTLLLGNHRVTTLQSAVGVPLDNFLGFDLVLLDVMMPEESGFQLCERIRGFLDCPILFLTAMTEEAAVVEGLLRGGDDYITKPFGIEALNARVDAHLRREAREKKRHRLVLEEIVFDFDKKEVYVTDKLLYLTKNEYKVCEYLVLNRGKTLTKEMIYEAIYDLDSDALLSTITEYIRSIRKKFSSFDCSPIATIWGVGYTWK